MIMQIVLALGHPGVDSIREPVRLLAHSSEFSEFNVGKYPLIVVFIAWVLFSPLVWLLVQIGLNKAADG